MAASPPFLMEDAQTSLFENPLKPRDIRAVRQTKKDSDDITIKAFLLIFPSAAFQIAIMPLSFGELKTMWILLLRVGAIEALFIHGNNISPIMRIATEVHFSSYSLVFSLLFLVCPCDTVAFVSIGLSLPYHALFPWRKCGVNLHFSTPKSRIFKGLVVYLSTCRPSNPGKFGFFVRRENYKLL